MHELILGGQRSGKSRCAEQRAADWLNAPQRSAVLLVTAHAGDDEMRQRIAHHQRERAARLPALECLEVPVALAPAIRQQSAPDRLVVVDCLTLWLTNLLMPLTGESLSDREWRQQCDALCEAIGKAPGPVRLVSNEIGLGLSPMSAQARRFVDELGRLHQRVAACCDRVTLMVAGIEVPVKREGR